MKMLNKVVVGAVAVLSLSQPLKAADSYNFNLRVNPFAAAFNVIDVSAEVKVLEKMTIVGSYVNWDLLGIQWNAFGGGANWYFNGALSDSVYLGALYENATVTTISASENIARARATLAYQWMFTNFDINMGVTYTSSQSTLSTESAIGFLFDIGFAF